jgi:hypothetical protein
LTIRAASSPSCQGRVDPRKDNQSGDSASHQQKGAGFRHGIRFGEYQAVAQRRGNTERIDDFAAREFDTTGTIEAERLYDPHCEIRPCGGLSEIEVQKERWNVDLVVRSIKPCANVRSSEGKSA